MATKILLLLQTPPEVVSLNALLKPMHIFVVPIIADGYGDVLTVTFVVAIQPEPIV